MFQDLKENLRGVIVLPYLNKKKNTIVTVSSSISLKNKNKRPMSQQGIYKKELTFAEQKCEPMVLLQNKTQIVNQ